MLVRRESGPDRHISVISVDLAAALAAPGSDADAALMPRDRITVFDLQSGRDRVIQPVLEELRLQGNAQQPTQVVHVDGRVKVPGDYPLEPGMTVSDLIRAGGGTTDAAYGQSAELVRYTVVNGEMRQTDLIDVDLSGALQGRFGRQSAAAALRHTHGERGAGVALAGSRDPARRGALPGRVRHPPRRDAEVGTHPSGRSHAVRLRRRKRIHAR